VGYLLIAWAFPSRYNAEMSNQPDHPGVIIFPPLLFLLALLAMLGLHWLWPLPMGEPVAFWIGVALIALGPCLAIWGALTMRKSGTAVSPYHSSTAIVTSGPFRFSRNPLYLALILLLSGITLAIDTWWGFIVLVPTVLSLHYGIVLREESYLERKFDGIYREYKTKVRRYL
jgi:protein-S-isoprenylcysteine O-methyltransferase Ste14